LFAILEPELGPNRLPIPCLP